MVSRRIPAVLLIGLVVLAGCSGFQPAGSGDGGPDAQYTAGAGGEPVARDEADTNGHSPVRTVQTRRAIVQTGRVGLKVSTFVDAREDIVALTRTHGGFVAGSARTVHSRKNREWTSGRLVLRVPSENFTDLKTAVERTGTVQRSQTNREDVTDKLVDLEARLANLRAERDRLRQLYERANDTEDVLAVGDRLADVQGEIERLEAKHRTLENRVALSTLTVELSEPRPGIPLGAEWYDVGVVNAFLSSVAGVGVLLRAIVVGVAYALPYAIVFGAPIAIGGWLLRRRTGVGWSGWR